MSDWWFYVVLCVNLSHNRKPVSQVSTKGHKLILGQLVSNAFISFAPRQEIEKKPYEPSSSIIVEC